MGDKKKRVLPPPPHPERLLPPGMLPAIPKRWVFYALPFDAPSKIRPETLVPAYHGSVLWVDKMDVFIVWACKDTHFLAVNALVCALTKWATLDVGIIAHCHGEELAIDAIARAERKLADAKES